MTTGTTAAIDEPQLEAHRTELTGYAYRMLGSAFEAEDAVQETMIRAWKALDRFEGRSQLIAYFQMWHTGQPAAQQCEGCTFSTAHITELSYLHSRGVTYATFCEGPYA